MQPTYLLRHLPSLECHPRYLCRTPRRPRSPAMGRKVSTELAELAAAMLAVQRPLQARQ